MITSCFLNSLDTIFPTLCNIQRDGFWRKLVLSVDTSCVLWAKQTLLVSPKRPKWAQHLPKVSATVTTRNVCGSAVLVFTQLWCHIGTFSFYIRDIFTSAIFFDLEGFKNKNAITQKIQRHSDNRKAFHTVFFVWTWQPVDLKAFIVFNAAEKESALTCLWRWPSKLFGYGLWDEEARIKTAILVSFFKHLESGVILVSLLLVWEKEELICSGKWDDV